MENRRAEVTPFPERPKNNLEKLKRLVEAISERVNKDLENQYGVKQLLNPDGTISIEGYAEGSGIYSKKEVAEDLESDYQSEVGFAVAYKHAFKSPEQEAQVLDWRKSKNSSKANQIELAIMVLLYRVLKDEFIVVRSATHDDYQGGVDNLIVNKKTGDVLCAIDDVHTEDSGREDRDPNRGKAEKTAKIAQRGGAKVKYGLTMEKGKLKKSALNNVPVFYLGLTSDQFSELLSTMSADPDSAPGPAEMKFFSQMTDSLEQQKNSLNLLNLKPGIKNNLSRLDSSLQRFKQIATASDVQSEQVLKKAA